uniref:Reverse transcriptase domain-containing protein n=1 Tax=Tanacetum cinerariifolium TaxID=118510 RepID=A0A6L2L9N0_TANCI|nr:hypothetical protein [Tanacetum cinerariifolium]
MMSFDYRLNPLYPIKECSSCGALYTTDYCCSEGSLGDKIICDLNKTPDLSQRSLQNFSKCGHPVDGHYCQGSALLCKKFKEDLVTSFIENEILQDSSEPSNDNTNVVNALREPFVGNQDPGIFCHQCTCELCGNGAHYGYTCSLKVPIIPDPKPFNNQTIKIHACYDDDDDNYTFAITPNEPDNSLSMGDKHLDTVLAMESDEFVKSGVENLVPIPSEPEGEHDDDPSFSNEDFLKEIYSNPLFDEEVISMKIDPHHFNVESDLIESFDSLMEEIDLSFTMDYPMPPGIEEDDYDSERDILILEEFLSNNSLLILKNESFHFGIPLFSRPPAKPPDGNTRILNVKMRGNISEQKVPMPRLMITLVPNQEKSLDLLSYLGHKAFQPSVECPMIIYGKNTPILDVFLFHFCPLDQFKYGGIGSSLAT